MIILNLSDQSYTLSWFTFLTLDTPVSATALLQLYNKVYEENNAYAVGFWIKSSL